MALIDDLERILEWHNRHNTPVARLLQPGLAEAEIQARLSRLPFTMPGEYVDLYRWRNGIPAALQSAGTWLFEYHQFLTLDDSLAMFAETYPIMKQFYQLSDWVLTFPDPAGDGYGVAGSAGPTAPVTFLFEGEGVQIVFESLAHMMRTVAACFDESVFAWERGVIETDFDALGRVAGRLNPNVPFWRDYSKSDR